MTSAQRVSHSRVASDSAGRSNADHLDLVELVDAQDAARVLARPRRPRAGSRASRRRTGSAVGRLDDLVAMDVGDRDLGRRHQVELVARDDVHLVFLVRDLPGAAGGRGVDQGRRPDLGHAVLARVDAEHEVDQRALERRAGAAIDRETGAGDLGAGGEIEHAQGLAHLPVRPRGGHRRRIRGPPARPTCAR